MVASRTREQVDAELDAREAEMRANAIAIEGHATPPPVGDLAANPAVQAMVAKAVAAAVAPLLAQLQEKRGGDTAPGDRQFLEGLALALRQIDDQGRPSSRRTVAPEILAARAHGRERMVQAILDARAAEEEPEYEILARTYLGDEMVEPFAPNAKTFMGEIQLNPWLRSEETYGRTRIIWLGVPNEAMRPANTTAKRIYAHFLESIGGGGDAAIEDPLAPQLKRLEGDGLKVRQRQKPQPVRILGTIAEPAQGQY